MISLFWSVSNSGEGTTRVAHVVLLSCCELRCCSCCTDRNLSKQLLRFDHFLLKSSRQRRTLFRVWKVQRSGFNLLVYGKQERIMKLSAYSFMRSGTSMSRSWML